MARRQEMDPRLRTVPLSADRSFSGYGSQEVHGEPKARAHGERVSTVIGMICSELVRKVRGYVSPHPPHLPRSALLRACLILWQGCEVSRTWLHRRCAGRGNYLGKSVRHTGPAVFDAEPR